MKLQNLVLGLALAVAGSAFAATTHETTVTRVTPHGTVTRHVVRTSERQDLRHGQRNHVKKVVVIHPSHRQVRKVVIVHPAQHGRHVANRTVVVHRHAA
jgi:hypothetical protein